MRPALHIASDFEQERNIILTLLYFDIFNYPLTASEIADFSPSSLTKDFNASLNALAEKHMIFEFENYYSLCHDPKWILRRRAGNALAADKMKTARRFSILISWFPFVRAVMLSGSISKGYMDAQSDIDYFIITAHGRLWTVRTCLALFRRLFLFNSHRNFCTNYFISERALEIDEKNIFTATELTTLVPMYGETPIRAFHSSNLWCSFFLPNRQPSLLTSINGNSVLKKFSEKILSFKWFNSLDHYFMNVSIRHWKNAYKGELDDNDFSIAFKSSPDVSRSHPGFYQKKVLNRFLSKIQEYERKHGMNLLR